MSAASGAKAGRHAAVRAAGDLLGAAAAHDVPLGPLTTYRVGGRAALFVEVGDDETLERLAGVVARTGVDVLVVGKGSNLLVSDAGFAGVALRLSEPFAAFTVEDGTTVVAGGALAYPVLARRSAALGLTGMEWAVGIPGSVGGAVRMNAGGHGAETSERLESAVVVRLADGDGAGDGVVVRGKELGFSYRHSAIGPGDVVVRARYSLEEGSAEEATERISEIVRWRRENQPGGQNAGSVFTNPPGDSAGRIVDSLGLKGFRAGSAAVSDKHANFIQADPGGSADDVRRVIDEVRRRVAAETGIELDVEVRWIGG